MLRFPQDILPCLRTPDLLLKYYGAVTESIYKLYCDYDDVDIVKNYFANFVKVGMDEKKATIGCLLCLKRRSF